MGFSDFIVSGWLLIVIVCGVSLWYLIRQPWKNHHPGPFSFPVLGSMPFLKDKDICKAFVKLGPIVKLNFGVQTLIVVNGFEAISKILVDNGAMFSSRPHNFVLPVDLLGK